MGRKKQEMKKKKKKAEFDKYDFYQRSVQSPDSDVIFFRNAYKELRGKKPTSLREDFCGTFQICCEWVKLDPAFQAIGIDLDPEPIGYGMEHHMSQLNSQQKDRVEIIEDNVLNPNLPKADIVSASNFSYFIFKTREEVLKYFKSAHSKLNDDGLFIVDCFGGSQCQEPNEEETEHDGFSYFWDQDSFDPVTNYAQFYIHFKVKGEKKKREKVFSYDWRMWSIPELKDIMTDAGFSKVHVYWEGTDKDGEGDGVFARTEVGEDCEAWVAYIVAEK